MKIGAVLGSLAWGGLAESQRHEALAPSLLLLVSELVPITVPIAASRGKLPGAGMTVVVPRYQSMQEGDKVTLTVECYEPDGTRDDTWKKVVTVGKTHLDQNTISDGVPRSYFDWIDPGYVLAYYEIEFAVGGRLKSPVQRLEVESRSGSLPGYLDKPAIEGHSEGDPLDPNKYPDGLLIKLPKYPGIADSDHLILIWSIPGGAQYLPSRVDPSTRAADSIVFQISPELLAISRGSTVNVSYLYGREGAALSSQVLQVDVQLVRSLGGPRVEGADQDGAGDRGHILADSANPGGVYINVPAGIVLPDEVLHVHWSGYGPLGEYVAEAPFSAEKPLRFHIPAKYVPANMGRTPVDTSFRFDVFYRLSKAPGAQLNMQASTVEASRADGVALVAGASANVAGNSRVVSDRFGLRLQRNDTEGASAVVTDSYVEGGNAGALVSAASRLTLQRSTLVGSGTATAAQLFGNAELIAQDSTIVGGSDGLRVLADSAFTGPAKVNLVGSTVEGKDGSAIVVGNPLIGPAKADIIVAGGTSLVASNGVLLDVVGGSDANMTVDNSHLVGDVRVEAGSTASLMLDNQASLTGRLENVAGLSLSNQARWNMVEDSQVGSLALDGGVVNFGEPGQFQRLTLGTLAGNGTFVMDADFSTGESDFLDVGNASGTHSLLVSSSGADPLTENRIHLVHTAAGDASFSLLGGVVDLGAFSYELLQQGGDWYLDGSRKIISPGTASALALFNTAPTVWYGELTTLRSRMGELRLDERKSGAWMRAYGNKYNVSDSAGSPYSQVQRGFSIGADAPLPVGDGQWLVGVMAGHSSSDLDLIRGSSAEVKSYYVGLYTTWLDAQSGYYFDGVVKANRFDNSAKVEMSDGKRSKGDFNNVGVGASAEFGRNIDLGQGYFVEPYTQWSVVSIQGKDYHLDNGLQARGDDARSVLGKAGATVGRTLQLGNGQQVQPYVRLAYVHEFIRNNEVKVNDHRFDNDLSGSRAELGMGVAINLNDRMQLHADFDYSNGEKIEQPWGANVGLHYSW